MVKRIILCVLLLAYAAHITVQMLEGQQESWRQKTFTEVQMQYIPVTPVTIIQYTVRCSRLHLANVSSSAVTCNLTDRGTGCNGGPCAFWPDIQIDAKQVYNYDLGSVVASRGVQWSCSASNAVVGTLQGFVMNYTGN